MKRVLLVIPVLLLLVLLVSPVATGSQGPAGNATYCVVVGEAEPRDKAEDIRRAVNDAFSNLLDTVEQKQKEKWAKADDWWNTLTQLLDAIGKSLEAGLSIFHQAMAFLFSILQYLPVIIPLHVIAAFTESPEKGVSVINFYVSLGKKLVDLVIKVLHALISLFDAITPFT